MTILRKKIKNITLRIKRDGTVYLSVPFQYSLQAIHQFINLKQNWINNHRTRLLAQPPSSPSDLNSGDLLPFLGRTYSLIIQEHTQPQRIIFVENQIVCYVKSVADLKTKQKLLQDWYRKEMSQLLSELIKKWEPIIGVQVMDCGIKTMKTRWGSCNTCTKKIWMNLQLMHESLACLEYVLVHEMVHLLEASHNKRFYALMNQFLPGWEKYREQLRQGPQFLV